MSEHTVRTGAHDHRTTQVVARDLHEDHAGHGEPADRGGQAGHAGHAGHRHHAAMIRTGSYATSPLVRTHLGGARDEILAGLVHVGGVPADHVLRPSPRTPAAERTQWRGFGRHSLPAAQPAVTAM